jgi:hypothetical protein
MKGQINLDTKLGQHIYNIIKNHDIKTILDIGTWNGYGSTMCCLQSIIDNNKNCNFISVEANHEQFLEAKLNLKNYVKYVQLFYGRITHLNDLVSLNDYDESFFTLFNKDLQEQWYQVDVNQHATAPYIYDTIISIMNNHINLLISDGGEYCSHGEFNKLKDIVDFIILDDTNTIKNYNTAEIIRKSPDQYEILADDTNERNGFMVCRKK